MSKIELQTLVGELKENYIFHVEFNRPKALNAMSYLYFEEMKIMFHLIEQLKKTHDIRVVVFTGRGKHFTAGLDLKEAGQNMSQSEETDGARKSIKLYDLVKDWQASMSAFGECSVPVIVGVHGYCLGGGIDLITSADIRVCTSDAVFSIKEIDIGMAADIGTLQRINLVTNNPSTINELIYTARNFSAQEAKELGLVSKVYATQEEMNKAIFDLAKVIASKSPVGVYTSKAVIRAQQNKLTRDNLDQMARINSAMLLTTDVMEAVGAALTKGKPAYPKL